MSKEQSLRTALLAAGTGLGMGDLVTQLETSATEQEIRRGILDVAQSDHVLIYMRRIRNPEAVPPDHSYWVERDAGNRARLEALKAWLTRGQVRTYETEWTGRALNAAYLDQFCDDVCSDLARLIREKAGD